ncbi:MAG: CsbD family protein [Candidatus Binatia bacterium]
MNRDQFKGSWKQFKGELKKKWGQFTDDDLLEAEGDYDKFIGVVQKRYGDKKEEVSQWTDEWYSKRERERIEADKATQSRKQM